MWTPLKTQLEVNFREIEDKKKAEWLAKSVDKKIQYKYWKDINYLLQKIAQECLDELK